MPESIGEGFNMERFGGVLGILFSMTISELESLKGSILLSLAS